MQEYYNTKGKHITEKERYFIEKWKKEGKSNKEISRLLGKNHQTINNEIKRGLIDLSFHGGTKEYSAQKAQNDYHRLRLAVGRTDTSTVEKETIIKEKIMDKYSPEMISQLPDMPSCTTIYSWVYKGWISGISRKLLLYPRKHKPIKFNEKRPPRKANALSIEQRPQKINERKEIGHFEIDLVILNKKRGQQLLTLTDRKTRYEIIRLIPDKTAQSVNTALTSIQQDYLIRSLTADSGSEFLKLDEAITYPIYYAHPFSSYERGSNENANQLIRRWFPKGTTTVTPNEVTAIEQWINHYPRKLFNYVCSYDLPEVANLLL
ncbi:IS30 family transposase [Carnobacteriaceae bacterium zg-84]|uniref:IS30 family transposase n=1 Tax=Granulicatella sp. zg-84 TaxID=2678503 RepID=UPI0013C09CA1|nr:IS30 family transposase [Granulicatella sp. zg-84]NEW66897.1 IS30 family transposase [Granulicatella sp. zg-84]QMI86173.1 IS30 family transposase [Carnobacteriaceae bacterium zg-84]